jgi:glyoxylase-like metal-dependent hydrolase (beta-lactamase superfamily II)
LRAVGVHADAVVAVSGIWQTTCTALRGGGEAFLVDSPVLPAELEALPSLLHQAAFPAVQGLLVTHADWDHLLGRYAFPEAGIGCAESSAQRLRAEPGAAQRELRAFDGTWYVQRPGPLPLAGVQGLPVPGQVELGDRTLELHPAPGHTADGMAVLAPWAGLLCCGDYLSPVEVPWISAGGSLPAYRETLERLRGLVARAETVVPGHGAPLGRADALALLDADLRYLEALERHGAAAPLPEGRSSAAQRRIHAENVERVHGATTLPGVAALHHVALELRPDDLEACLAFYALVGFEEVPVPDERLEGKARWVQGGATQIHLQFADDPVVPPRGHVALVLGDDYDAALERLRGAGFAPEERTRYWGAPRGKVKDPAGHAVELMEAAP